MEQSRQYPARRSPLPPPVRPQQPAREPRPGLLSLVRRGVEQRLAEPKYALLRADRLNDQYRDREGFARQIRSLSSWLGRDLRVGMGDRSNGDLVRLAEVEENGRKKVRLILTDQGVSALAKRLGMSFFIVPDLAPIQGEFAMVKVRAVLPDGRVVDKLGRDKGTEQVNLQRAEAAAQRAAVYEHLGLSFSPSPRYLSMEFVTRDYVHNPIRARKAAVKESPARAAEPEVYSDTIDLIGPAASSSDRRPDEMALLASKQQLDDIYKVAQAYGLTDQGVVQARVASALGENVPLSRITTEEADRVIAQPDVIFGRAAVQARSAAVAGAEPREEERLF